MMLTSLRNDTRRVSPIEGGFTLVEILVAMFIFSLISVGTMTALNATLRGKAHMTETLDKMNEIESARAVMKSDFSNIILRPGRDLLGGMERYLLEGKRDNQLMNFTRSGRANPGGLERRSEFQRIAYVFEGGKLIRRVLAHENPAPQTRTHDRILFENLSNASFEFGGFGLHSASVLPDISPSFGLEIAPDPYLNIEEAKENGVPQSLLYNRLIVTLSFENGDVLTQLFEIAL